ncbi:MAG: HEAT repeat domain-containing protein [Candidatus Riflebacteria bacterium]|nr:HEAT repeat domain-containing protein [Candidatus Riflebacteria bacterium]
MDIKIKRLIKDLTNSDDDLRALSAMTLMKLDFPDRETREAVLENLIEATRDRNVSVRFFARKAIDKIKKTEKLLRSAEEPATGEKIDENLISIDYEDRLAGVMEIKSANLAQYKDQLIKMLDTEEHAFVRAALISSLKLFIDKQQAGILSHFLNDPDNRVRSNTIEALEDLGVEESIPSLFSALSDPDNRIRAVAAKALQSFGEEKVFTELKKMLHSPEEWMKGSAIYALSHIQAGEAIELLVEAVRVSTHADTRIKAIVALANYHDLTAWTFLRGLGTNGEGVFKETAIRSLKLMEEKFGLEPPTETMVTQLSEEKIATPAAESKGSDEGAMEDIASAVGKFFRQGKDEAVGLSNKAKLSFSVTDLRKEADEVFKEAGRTVFDFYQAGEVQFPELLTTGHEILRMNFFIQKYAEQEEKAAEKKPQGFFEQLKGLFSKSPEEKKSASQGERFSKKRDELFLKMGQMALKKYEAGEFQPKQLEAYFLSWQKLQKKIGSEQKKS